MSGADARRTVSDLMKRLEEAEDTIRAIRNGEVDAFVMRAAEEERVFAVASADGPYRLLVERMQQGAATLSSDGAVLYCNQRFAELLSTSPEHVFGESFGRFVQAGTRLLWNALAAAERKKETARERSLSRGSTGASFPFTPRSARSGRTSAGSP